MKEKQYEQYSLNEKIIFAKGFNLAISQASKIAETHHRWIGSADYANPIDNREIAEKIKKLDKSMKAMDD